MVEETPDIDSNNAILQVYSRPSKPFTVNFCTDGITLTFEVDTGAAVDACVIQQLGGKAFERRLVHSVAQAIIA